MTLDVDAKTQKLIDALIRDLLNAGLITSAEQGMRLIAGLWMYQKKKNK